MSEKAILTKEQAETIEKASTAIGKKVLVKYYVSQGYFKDDDLKPLNELDLDTLIRALYVGYEVKQTPEEKVMEYYEELNNLKSHTFDARYRMDGVRKTLDLLGIKIKGINDV